ncbi:MAG: DegT/DnrJ/EryC1/StrS family aminotransferase [Ruminococcaceae bacterium]|nr:DegT/DnrJ/EryC1/StrS family aminotransferase [Oscillospiraceae bacterium]
MSEKLALLGGKPAIDEKPYEELFKWPIITAEDEAAAMDVIRKNSFSATDITEKFQDEFAEWMGRKYAIAYCNGTASLTAAMFAIGLGKGDEIICPTKTYWGSVSQAINFGASAVFCNIDNNLSMDPADLERCITPKTKAIMVVHYYSYPCDMDKIMEIANKHNLIVIEDVSHAQGVVYKGKKVGTFGHIAAMSLMSGKAFAAGELGILVTDDTKLYERAMAFGHYERNNENYIKESDDLKDYFHIALGGIKGRANQLCAALARGQLKYYDERTAEIRKAMNYFWDLLEGVPGIRSIRVNEEEGSHMGGWYSPHGIYIPEELGGLSVKKFCEALRAEGVEAWEGGNFCLHTHKFFKTFDFDHSGAPSRIAYNDRDVRLDDDKCKPSESIYCYSVPWFKKFDKEWIEKYANAFKKVVDNYEQLLEGDEKGAQGGRWYGMENA